MAVGVRSGRRSRILIARDRHTGIHVLPFEIEHLQHEIQIFEGDRIHCLDPVPVDKTRKVVRDREWKRGEVRGFGQSVEGRDGWDRWNAAPVPQAFPGTHGSWVPVMISVQYLFVRSSDVCLFVRTR